VRDEKHKWNWLAPIDYRQSYPSARQKGIWGNGSTAPFVLDFGNEWR